MRAIPFPIAKQIGTKADLEHDPEKWNQVSEEIMLLAKLEIWRLTMVERRRFPRTKVFKGAKVASTGRSTVSCIVRDLSSHGACLHLQNAADLPVEFDLSFDTGHTRRKCRIAWRTPTNVGVSFDNPTAR